MDLVVSGRWQPPQAGQYEPATSPVTGELIGQMAQGDRADVGLPPGAVAFLPGPGPVVGDEIAGHPGVAAVAFVGSTQTGLSVARRAAGKAQLLEMGNNGPLVLNNADVAAKTARHVADALERGADLVTGGDAEPGRPTALYWQPAVLDNVPRDAVVAREETFGPVAPLITVASPEDAITLTDDLPYGLMASIYTADARTGLRYADAVRAARVNINESSNYLPPPPCSRARAWPSPAQESVTAGIWPRRRP